MVRAMKRLLPAIAILALSACATPVVSAARTPGVAYARIGETVYVDGPKVTPRRVLEDSRCPRDVQCAWAGRVRLLVTVHLGSRDEERELVLNVPAQVADGALTLVEVEPVKRLEQPVAQTLGYRFGFRFAGGL